MGLSASELLVIMLVCAISLAAFIVVVALIFKYQQRRLWHETARAALEKGQPLPPQPGPEWAMHLKHWQDLGLSVAQIERLRRNRWRRDRRGGLVMLAIGVGVYLGLASIDHGERLRVFAYVPGCIGLALLVNGLINVAFPGREADTRDRPPEA
jgi:hypothetical protein